MAVENRKKVSVENIETKARVENNTNNNTTSEVPGFDFYSGFMRPQGVSQHVKEFKDGLIEVLKTYPLFEFKVLAFDNQTNAKGFPYSFVVVAGTRSDIDKAFFMPFLLEITGRGPVNINSILEIDPATGVLRIKDKTALLTPSSYFVKQIIEKIKKSVETSFIGKEAVYIDGEVIPSNADLSRAASVVAPDAGGGIYIAYTKIKGLYQYLKVDRLISDNHVPYADITLNSGLSTNALGRIVATDFNVNLYTKKQSQNNDVFFIDNEIKNIGNITGFVEETVVIDKTKNPNGIAKVGVPINIIDEVVTDFPTIEHSLLSIVSSAVLNDRNILLELLYNKDNIGAINFLTNIEGKEGFGSIVNLKDKKYTKEKAFAFINNTFMLNAALALDVEIAGKEYFKLSPFAALHFSEAAKANEAIVKAAEEMTNSTFQNRNVATYTIEVPLGEWVDNGGNVRDLREIDLVTIISLTKDPLLIQKWMASNDDPKISGINPLLTKLEVYSKLGLNAKMTGKAIRVFFNGLFISELITKLEAIGFKPIKNANINFTNFMDLSEFTSNSILNTILTGSMGTMPGFNNQPYYINPNYMTGFYY